MQNSESNPSVPSNPQPVPKKGRPVLLFLAAFFTVVLLAAVAGLLSGQVLHRQREAALNEARMEEQCTLAGQDLAEGRYDVAVQRLEYILSLEPEYPGVQEMLDQANRGLNATPTPQPTETPIPSPTPDVSRGEQMLLRAQQQFRDGDYHGTYVTLLEMKSQMPSYEAARVDGLIWVALRYEGVSLIADGRLTEGMYYLDLAQNYVLLDSKAADRDVWAEVLLSGYQGAYFYRSLAENAKAENRVRESEEYYEESIAKFEQVYNQAPNYRADIFGDYVQTLRDYGEWLLYNGKTCAAYEIFEKALSHMPEDPDLLRLRDDSANQCAPPVVPTPETTATPEE